MPEKKSKKAKKEKEEKRKKRRSHGEEKGAKDAACLESTAVNALNGTFVDDPPKQDPEAAADESTEKRKQKNTKKDKVQLTDETISKMLTVCEDLLVVKQSIHDTIQLINEHEEALLELEFAASNLEKVCSNCQLVWKIDNFKHKYMEAVSGKNATLYSPPFETHKYGYKLALSFSPYGDGRAKGTYASLFFCILKTDYDALLKWPFCHKLTFSILDQRMAPPFTPPGSVVRENYVVEFTPNPVQENKAFIGRPTGFRNSSFGLPRFISVDQLRDEKYLINNSLYISVQVHLQNVAKH